MRKAVFPVIVGALICWGAAHAAAQAIQPPRDNATPTTGTGTLRGRVVTIEARNPIPIRDARVSISAPGIDPVFTDSSGRFEFTRLPAGRYTLTAEKTGFARTRYGSRNDLDPAIPVDVGAATPANTLDGIEIRIPRGAAISGRVVNELGEPVVGAPVTVGFLRTAGAETRFVAASRPVTQTDDRGEYRAGGLPAGRYYVSIAGAAEGASIPFAPTEWTRTTGWMRTFYPAASGVAGAAPVVVGAGEEIAGVDMTLAASPPAKLSLGILDATGAFPASGGLINLVMPGDAPGDILSNRGVPLGPATNGKMTPALEAGDWVAVALGTTRALAHIHLAPGEVTSLMLTLSPGARVAGRVVFDGTSAAPAFTSVRLGVRGAGQDTAVPSSGLSNGPVTVKSDGSFEMTALAGTIVLQPASPLRGWMLRSVTLGERDLLDNPLTLTGSEDITGVQVIFTDQLADLSGTAVDAVGGPSAGCAVAIFPSDGSAGFASRRTRLLRADQNGRFSVSDLASGSYLAAAMPDVDGEAWLSDDYLRRLRTTAVPVTLADHEKKTITLTCAGVQ
jgi:hypothetical protein